MAKFKIDLTDQPTIEWTTRQQRAWIREATRALNKEFLEIQLAGEDLQKDYPLLAQQRDKLIELGTGKEFRGGIGLGLTYKTKAELQLQARALKETLNMVKGETTEAATSDGYDAFLANHPGMKLDFSEYQDMVEVMGAAGEHLLNNFGNSETFVEAYNDAREHGKSHVDVMKAIVEANREARGQGLTTNQMLTRLRKKLDIYNRKQPE